MSTLIANDSFSITIRGSDESGKVYITCSDCGIFSIIVSLILSKFFSINFCFGEKVIE